MTTKTDDAIVANTISELNYHLDTAEACLQRLGDWGNSWEAIRSMFTTSRAERSPRGIAHGLMHVANLIMTDSSTEAIIRTHLMTAKSSLPGDQTPAIECAVVLRGMSTSLTGALSETPQGGLRLLSPMGDAARGHVPMVEQFFEYSDVLTFGVRRDIELTGRGLLVTPS